jgi:dihydroorotase
MTIYLTDQTTAQDIIDAKESGLVYAAKLYPAGVTTNSASGVTDIAHVSAALEIMSELGMPLLIHGEVTDKAIDIFDREQVFLETVLPPIVEKYTSLKIILEHITTKQAVDFVKSAGDNIAATITAHHLLFNRNHMLVGAIRPHYFCLPILKRNIHQQALIEAATSGSAKFFLGTDSAPHAKHAKESACGCAGSYTAHAAIELYAEVFDKENALDKLEAFASINGPTFYQLPVNTDTITLEKKSWTVPATMRFGEDVVVPIRADEDIQWQVV